MRYQRLRADPRRGSACIYPNASRTHRTVRAVGGGSLRTGQWPSRWLESAMPLSSFASWSEFQREQAREQMADDAPHVRPPNRFYRKFTQASMENIIEKLHPEEFKRSYGVNIDTYREILETIGDDIRIESQGHGGVRNSEVIEPAIKLAVTLRWLRGGSYIDLWERYGISRSTFQRATHEVMHAINRHYTMPFAGRLRRYLSGEATDEDVEALSTIAQGFAQHTGGIIDRCLGAIDGVLVDSAHYPHPTHSRSPLLGPPTTARARRYESRRCPGRSAGTRRRT